MQTITVLLVRRITHLLKQQKQKRRIIDMKTKFESFVKNQMVVVNYLNQLKWSQNVTHMSVKVVITNVIKHIYDKA